MSPEDLSASWQKDKKLMSVYDWLQSIGLYHKIVPRDPSSLFRAVSEWIYDTQRYHNLVRKESMFYLKLTNNSLGLPIEISINDYSNKMMEETSHGGFNEIALLSHFYKRDFIVIDSKEGPIFKYCYSFGSPVYLYYVREYKHFDTLLPIKYVETMSFCQSIVYEVLLKNVFTYKYDKIGDRFFIEEVKNDYQSNRKELNSLIKYGPLSVKDDNCCNVNNRSKIYSQKQSNIKKTGFVKKYHLPNKIFKGLCPILYKNVEYDTWVELKKEKENAIYFHDGISLQVGVKCMLKIDPNQDNLYTCHIQVMRDDGQCLVYVEELGEKKTVDSSQLISLPADEAKSWYTHKRSHLKHMLNKSANEMIVSADTKARRFNLKNKKSNRVLQDAENITMNRSKTFFKTENLDSKLRKDDNNNSLISETEIMSSSYSTVEWENRNGKDGALNNIQCLEKFTRVDHITFKPPYMEYVTMPLNTEINGNFRENTLNRQNSHYYPTNTAVVTCNSPCISYAQPANNNSESNSLSNAIYTNASTPNSTSTVPPTGNGNNGVSYSGSYSPSYPSYPLYCAPPGGFPPIRPSSVAPWHYRNPNSPIGINFNAQRSVNLNGSDLPYNDIPTLRYFFNLGLECSQNMGLVLPQFLPPPPSVTPIGSSTNAYYQSTPDQLALEMQNNLTVDDLPNTGSSVQNVKEHVSKPHKFNEYRGGRGGHSKFRRNDGNTERNNKNGPNFNRGHYNNGQRKHMRNGNYSNNNSSDNSEKKEQENESALIEQPSIPPNYPFIPYPPPFYRHPSYSMESPQFVPSVYQNFLFAAEDGAVPPEESGYLPPNGALPQQYMTYITPPPPPFFYTSPNGPNYYANNFSSSPSIENQPPPKN